MQLNVLRSPNAEEQTSITFFNFDRTLTYSSELGHQSYPTNGLTK